MRNWLSFGSVNWLYIVNLVLVSSPVPSDPIGSGVRQWNGRELRQRSEQDVIDELIVLPPDSGHPNGEPGDELPLDAEDGLTHSRMLDVVIHVRFVPGFVRYGPSVM